jgi:hypothetical protein
MRTTFENLKRGSKFRPTSDDPGDYTKIDESHYSFQNQPASSIDPKFIVYPVEPYGLKNPKRVEKYFVNLDLIKVGKLFLVGCIAIWVLSMLLSSQDNSPATSEDIIAKKLANGEELNWAEKQVVKEWQNQGRKNNP